MIELDHLHVALTGSNLIEASAGTGKTYAISCLYLRLVIEQGLTPEQILVVTYTEAATKELRGRIRSRLREALAVLAGAATDDSFLTQLCERLGADPAAKSQARERLDLALKSFDTASIFTIHGFCLRALQDNAFESGSLYDTELVTDQADLLQEVVDDFWRMRFFTPSAPLLAYALTRRQSPESFIEFVKGMVASPKLEVVPTFSADDIRRIEETCHTAFRNLQTIWRQSKDEIRETIASHKGLSRSAKNYHQDQVPGLLANLEEFLAGDNPYDLFSGFGKFCIGYIESQRMKRNPPPEHESFSVCEELMEAVEERFLALRWELVTFCRERLPRRKREMNVRFFDDLLNDLYAALRSESGQDLADHLRQRFRAALIDEFQDTDPVQYDIFRAIYADSGCPLFLIGDPKQAIYSFRGADIFAYLEAAADVAEDKRFTLTGNWRSTPDLLSALNTVFTRGPRPFVYDQIAYHEVTSGRGDRGERLLIDGCEGPALHLWSVGTEDGAEEIIVGKANGIIPPAVAGEIARMVQAGAEGRAMIDDRPLVPGDIAVIVRSHRQAGSIQEALQEMGIPSVMRSDKSIFSTHEAMEVWTLMQALADAGNEPKVRAALVTDMLGRSGNDIARYMEDEPAWEELLQTFRAYHQLWLDRGFMVMAQSLLACEGVRGRLLRHPDGERRLTNLLHCFEAIHQQAHQMALGIESLLAWFGEQISVEEGSEEYQIRLETDEKAVKIVTVHVSKGLEYPVVFCPFLWGGIKADEEVITFHDGYRMVKDFGSPEFEAHRSVAQKESLAENLRLLYVALTRAKFRCYLVAGKISDGTKKNRPETSPISYLFHGSDDTRTDAEDLVGRLAGEVSGLSGTAVATQLGQLAEKGNGTIAVDPIPAPLPEAPSFRAWNRDEPLASREFAGIIRKDWRVASFTMFSAHNARPSELPDRDEIRDGGEALPAPIAASSEEKSIFTFPKGAQTGIFWHELLEKLDFSDGSPVHIDALVAKGLEKYGFEDAWRPCLSAMVDQVLKVPLQSPSGAFTLADLRPGSWIPEMEFFFPLRFISSGRLADRLRQWGAWHQAVDLVRVCEALDFRQVRGMVRGFVDLVFEHDGRYYLLDWKSNHLGHRLEDYGARALKTAMERNLYPLQYLLYTVALNRYLSLRVKDYDYETHFGGVLYMFLRGMDAGRSEEFGVFRDRPPKALIEELDRLLIESQGGGDHV